MPSRGRLGRWQLAGRSSIPNQDRELDGPAQPAVQQQQRVIEVMHHLDGQLRLLLEEAPRLIHEVVKTLVAAVDELTGTRHGVLDLLEREERWVPGRSFLGHDCKPVRYAVGQPQVMLVRRRALRGVASLVRPPPISRGVTYQGARDCRKARAPWPTKGTFMNAIGAVGVPKALLEAEDHAMRLAAVQMSRIARGLPAESKVRRQMMQNARWWRLSAVHPSTTGQQRGEFSV